MTIKAGDKVRRHSSGWIARVAERKPGEFLVWSLEKDKEGNNWVSDARIAFEYGVPVNAFCWAVSAVCMCDQYTKIQPIKINLRPKRKACSK